MAVAIIQKARPFLRHDRHTGFKCLLRIRFALQLAMWLSCYDNSATLKIYISRGASVFSGRLLYLPDCDLDQGSPMKYTC